MRSLPPSGEEATANLAALEALGYAECAPKSIYRPLGLEPPFGDELKTEHLARRPPHFRTLRVRGGGHRLPHRAGAPHQRSPQR